MRSLAVLKIEAFSRANEGNFTVPLAELQKIRYNRNMSITFRNTIRLEEYAGMELMPENPCGTGFHGGGGNF